MQLNIDGLHVESLSDDRKTLPRDFKEPLLGCFRTSARLFCKTCLCPCVQAGHARQSLVKNSNSCSSCLWSTFCCISTMLQIRSTIRSERGYAKQPWRDLLAVTCCCPCVLCQHDRELALSSADINTEERNHGSTVPDCLPPLQQDMMFIQPLFKVKNGGGFVYSFKDADTNGERVFICRVDPSSPLPTPDALRGKSNESSSNLSVRPVQIDEKHVYYVRQKQPLM
jgi:Cys-rich protein (TIGR01571 family)